MWPAVDFGKTELLEKTRKHLGKLYSQAVGGDASCGLLEQYIIPNLFDDTRGIYTPVSSSVTLAGKAPDQSKAMGLQTHPIRPLLVSYFTNPLTIASGYGRPEFEPSKVAPRMRATNAGYLVCTLEFDCKTAEEFEENCSWSRSGRSAPILAVDSELCRLREYRGFCNVFSGNRSIHHHFVFATTELQNAPASDSWERRLEDLSRHSALLTNLHRTYFEHVRKIFTEALAPSSPPDTSLRSFSQWKRMPLGVRLLSEDSKILGLQQGTQVPQLVLAEKILNRSSPKAEQFLVSPSYSVGHSAFASRSASRGATLAPPTSIPAAMICVAREILQDEWQTDYPRLESITSPNGSWTFHFSNDAADSKPSTIVTGEFRKLEVYGRNSLNRVYFLPDHMTAQEFGDYVALQVGYRKPTVSAPSRVASGTTRIVASLDPMTTISNPVTQRIEGAADGLTDPAEIIMAYRGAMSAAMLDLRIWDTSYICKAPEGIGKTHIHMPIVSDEALDQAMNQMPDDRIARFRCFAFRSGDQAEQKASECRANGQPAIVLRSIRHYYKQCCREVGAHAIAPLDLPSSAEDMLSMIKRLQPQVFDRLEAVRTALWRGPEGEDLYNPGRSLIFTTQATAKTFYHSRGTRTWYHPSFTIEQPKQNAIGREEVVLAAVVFDELEYDELIEVIPENLGLFIQKCQSLHAGWRNMPRSLRRNTFASIMLSSPVLNGMNFEKFNELMRLDLQGFQCIAVNFNAMPFGHDSNHAGIFRCRDGERYFVGYQTWPFSAKTKWSFLTTESLSATIAAQVFKKAGHAFINLNLDQLPALYPIAVPLYLDRRASKRGVQDLAKEITDADPNALVIANSVEGIERCKNFQLMKGMNGLENKNIYIIATSLSPDLYAKLNVVGQWLGIENVILQFYQDQIDQAVGRNRGFRQATPAGKCTIIASNRLYGSFLKNLEQQDQGRTRMYLDEHRPW